MEDWVCSICQRSNPDDTMFCGQCGNGRHIFISTQLKAGPGPAVYAYSTTASNAAAGWGSIWLHDELKRRNFPEDEMTALAEAAEEFKEKNQTLWKIFEDKMKERDEDKEKYSKEMHRTARARQIINLITYANYEFWKKRKVQLFRDKGEILKELLGPCANPADFTFRIQSLACVFEVKHKFVLRLRNLVPNCSKRWNAITLFEKMLEREKVQFDPHMFEIWRNIKLLRNAPPAHTRYQPIKVYEFFGKSFPVRDYQQLWDNILEKFLTSLVVFIEVLDRLPKRNENISG